MTNKSIRVHSCPFVVFFFILVLPFTSSAAPLIRSITKETLRRNRDGSSLTWFHPRACMYPGEYGQPVIFMTLQEIGGSDYFGPVDFSTSPDLGKTWSESAPIPALGRDPVPGHPGLEAGVCDVTPQYHPPSGTVLALMGNFHVANISPDESIVTVGEWMPENHARGDLLLARIRWSQPNRLPLW